MLAILDYKSGGVYWEAELQLGGYYLLMRDAYGVDADMGALVQTNAKHTQVKICLERAQLLEAAEAFGHAYALLQYGLKRGYAPAPTNRYIHPTTKESYISVTEVLRFAVAKPALLNWYLKCGKEGIEPRNVLKDRGAVGSAIHHRIQEYLVTKTPPTPDETGEVAEAVRHFVPWEATACLQPYRHNGTVFNDGVQVFHPTMQFAGSPDYVGQVTVSSLQVSQPHTRRRAKEK